MKHAHALFILALVLPGSAAAADERTSAMLWGSALNGSVRIGAATADFDVSVAEIIEVLDGSISLRHESRGADRGWYAEFVFNDLKKDTVGTLGERQANLEQTIFELGMTQPIDESWELYGGARWESVDNSIDFNLLPSVSAGTDWADVVLGVRWHRGSDRNRWWVRGDVAAGGSDGAWLFEAGGAWTFAETWEVTLAYKILTTEFADSSYLVDLEQGGMVLGVGVNW